MNLHLLQDTLIQAIQKFGSAARDYRQVSQRLKQLLPDRLEELVRDRRRRGLSPSEATREALASQEYVTRIEEITTVAAESFESRVQYETHMMLFEARRSLRAFRRRF